MKTKTFSNIGLSVLALVFLMSFASAATLFSDDFEDGDMIGWSATNWANVGTYAESTDTLATSLSKTISTSGFNTIIVSYDRQLGADWETADEFKVSWSTDGTTFNTLEDVVGSSSDALPDDASFVSKSFNLISSASNNANFQLKIECSTNAADEFCRIDNISVAGTAIPPTITPPEDVSDCTITGNSGQLEIKNIGFSVTDGFGDDEKYWYPFDEIEVEFDVQNDGQWDVDDIEIRVCLYDVSAEECVLDEGDMEINDAKFNLDWDNDDEQTVMLTFDVDPKKLNDGNTDYIFYIIAEGTIDDNDAGSSDGKDVCVSDSESIEIRTDETFIILNNFNHPETATCGEDVLVSFDVWNIGDQKIDKEDIFIKVFNQELKLEKTVQMDSDVRALDSERVEFSFKFPEDAIDNWVYNLDFTVYDNEDMDSGDIYENSENDEAEYQTSIKVEGCTLSQASALVSASLVSGGKAGEELVIKATITNTGDDSAVFTISPSDYNAWASLTSIDKTSLNLASGTSGDVTIKFAVDEDASGDNTFNIEVLSDGKSVIKQPVSVSIEEAGGFGITGSSIFSGDNTYLWIIGGLNVLLVVIIIIVAISVTRK